MSQIIKSDEPIYEHCYKCCLQLTPDVEFGDGHCPRCGNDLTIVDIGQELATEQQLKDKQAQKELYALILMVQNWGKAQRRYLGEVGVDWSAPHDMIEDIGQRMMPWIARLVQAGYFGRDEVSKISAVIDSEVEQIIQQLEAEEDIMRLTGQWSDSEQAIKEYWQEAMGRFRQVPMRNVKRVTGD